MGYGWNSAEEYMIDALPRYSVKRLARFLGVHNAHIYRARGGDITPMLRRAIAARGFAPPPPPRHRVRWSPDCTPELRDKIRASCEQEGMTSGQFLEAMWNAYNEFWSFLDE